MEYYPRSVSLWFWAPSNNSSFNQNVFPKHRILRSGVFEKVYLLRCPFENLEKISSCSILRAHIHFYGFSFPVWRNRFLIACVFSKVDVVKKSFFGKRIFRFAKQACSSDHATKNQTARSLLTGRWWNRIFVYPDQLKDADVRRIAEGKGKPQFVQTRLFNSNPINSNPLNNRQEQNRRDSRTWVRREK